MGVHLHTVIQGSLYDLSCNHLHCEGNLILDLQLHTCILISFFSDNSFNFLKSGNRKYHSFILLRKLFNQCVSFLLNFTKKEEMPENIIILSQTMLMAICVLFSKGFFDVLREMSDLKVLLNSSIPKNTKERKLTTTLLKNTIFLMKWWTPTHATTCFFYENSVQVSLLKFNSMLKMMGNHYLNYSTHLLKRNMDFFLIVGKVSFWFVLVAWCLVCY